MTKSQTTPNLTIDLGAITANYRRLQQELKTTPCSAVVKADAYGLGANHIAPALAHAGCKIFFVATLDEAITLRQTLPAPAIEIYVINGLLEGTEKTFIAHNISPVLNDPGQITRWQNLNTKQKAIIHLDTGLNRLGLSQQETETIINEPTPLKNINLTYFMSHLACADTPEHPMNQQQLTQFKNNLARLPKAKASLAASDGIFNGPDYHLDLGRPGAALYGICPLPNMTTNPMKNVITLTAPILQVRRVDKGQTVGYAANHKIDRPTTTVTVALGYADGYLRALSNKGFVHIKGHKLPVIGRISMDLITIDASKAPADLLHPGAEVEIIGEHHSVDQLGFEGGTIGYEILTSLGNRFHRTYQGATS